jgi:hypothetical protein
MKRPSPFKNDTLSALIQDRAVAHKDYRNVKQMITTGPAEERSIAWRRWQVIYHEAMLDIRTENEKARLKSNVVHIDETYKTTRKLMQGCEELPIFDEMFGYKDE